ncbi:500_t:CDS:1, partial [Funneliformis mosseae]
STFQNYSKKFRISRTKYSLILYAGFIENGAKAKTFKYGEMTFTSENGELYVGNANGKARITQPDVMAY